MAFLAAGRADVTHHSQPSIRDGEFKMFAYSGLFGLLILIGDIWAIVNIVQSSASTERKVLWIVLVLVLPFLGLLLWLLLGPRTGRV